MAAALDGGQVVALKGLGGYHLACRADDEAATAALRARKHREDKPFALMARDLDGARALVELTAGEEELLTGRERPIVIARRLAGARVADAVAPGAPDLGVMLPYTPLHHLLLALAGGPLVMTSANVSDEPIAYRDDDARERLVGIADLLVSHDRPIHIRTDDSVVRSTALGPLMVRRSRGYVPGSLELPVAAPVPITAYGAELKSTICVAKGERAWPSHHIGDLENWETLRSFREAIEHFERVFAVSPQVVAHDMHPEYLSTKEATGGSVPCVAVQHHHAHLAACLAEHGRTGPALGVIYDGTGYGTDGTVWGGELLAGDLAGFERAAPPVAGPPARGRARDQAAMADGVRVADRDRGRRAGAAATLAGGWTPSAGARSRRCAARGTASPVTTSAGRLCDAVAALCGVRTEVTYEGQAAIELEALATAVLDLPALPGTVRTAACSMAGSWWRAWSTNWTPAPTPPSWPPASTPPSLPPRQPPRPGQPANAAWTRSSSPAACSRTGCCWSRPRRRSSAHGLEVLRPERLPPNDGGISYGQAAVAAALTT